MHPIHSFLVASILVLDEFDLPAPARVGSDTGTVEAVQEAPLMRHRHAFGPDMFEHRLHPDTVETLVIRLDSGPVVTVARDPALRLQPGQRVRVILP
jgi:hypothetical protein